MEPTIPDGLVSDKLFDDDEMPGLGCALSIALLPVLLIAGSAIAEMVVDEKAPGMPLVLFLGSAPIALLLTLAVANWAFGPRVGRSLTEVM
jgi:Gnt-I system high-affinity gluconate transporter